MSQSNRFTGSHSDKFEVPDWESYDKPDLSPDMSMRTMADRIRGAALGDRTRKHTVVALTGFAIFVLGAVVRLSDSRTTFEGSTVEYNREMHRRNVVDCITDSMLATGLVAFLIATLLSEKATSNLYKDAYFMLEIREQFPEIPASFNINKLRRLEAVLPTILANLPPSDRAVLDTLLKDDAKRLLINDDLRGLITKMFENHLKTHPEDLEMIISAYKGVMTWNMAQQYAMPRTER